MHRIVILASGRGTNCEAIIKATKEKIIHAEVVGIISNKMDAPVLNIASKYQIPSLSLPFNSEKQTRECYDQELAKNISLEFKPDLIILAGWMHIFTPAFLSRFSNIINLHPALPNTFPGATGIQDAFKAFQEGKITKTGAMVHYVVEKIDTGQVITQIEIPIHENDTLKSLTARVQYHEKPLLLQAIPLVLEKIKKWHPKKGKVRDIYDAQRNKLCIYHSDRLSAFDEHVCDVPQKGTILNLLSKYWFEKTKDIIPNHLLFATKNYMIVKKCKPFFIEVIVRGYITGNTKTSLWTHYKKGTRTYCGIDFPDDLVKNQQIEPVITPTTKGEVDEPISAEELVHQKYMTQKEWDYISQKAMELFHFGQEHAKQKGFLLVDTKYEFGKDTDGNILLIDELHTCDSSRFWKADTYDERFEKGKDPEKLDKDCIRDYLKKIKWTELPSNSPQKVFPQPGASEKADEELIERVTQTYTYFYRNLISAPSCLPETMPAWQIHECINQYNTYYEDKAIIIAGSISDKVHVKKIEEALEKQGISSVSYYSSAHKNTLDVMEIIKRHDNLSRANPTSKQIWVTVAGRSNALSGVVAANSKLPVIACPPFKDKMDMTVNIHSTLQCPSAVPVLTTLEPGNVALAIKKIFQL